jgi:hypothetical protein
MPDDHERDRAPPGPAALGSPEPEAVQDQPGLTRSVQEHLGQQLRTTYHRLADKPDFLGDPALPAEFDPQIERLEARDSIRARGVEAVRTALEESRPPGAVVVTQEGEQARGAETGARRRYEGRGRPPIGARRAPREG